MKKRILSVLLVMLIALPVISVQVSADGLSAQILDGYTLSGWANLGQSGSDCGMTAGVTNSYAKSGDYSLCVAFPDNLKSGHKDYIKNTGMTISTVANHTYTMGMWVKTSDNTQLATYLAKAGLQVALIAEGVEFSDSITLPLKGSDVTIYETVDGWTRIERVWKTGMDRTAHNIAIMFDYDFRGYSNVEMLFDDVYFYDTTADDGVNFFDNPSFNATSPQQSSSQILSDYNMAGWANIGQSGSDCGIRAGATNVDAKSGDYSLCVAFPDDHKSGHKDYIKNIGKTISTVANHSYTMGMWVKTSDNTQIADFLSKAGLQILLIGETVEFDDSISLQLRNSDVTICETVDGWTRIERVWRTGMDRTAHNIAIVFDYDFRNYSNVEMLFDDVYFYDSTADDGVNFFDNPGFDAYPGTRTKISMGRELLRSSKGWMEYSRDSSEDNFYMQPVIGSGNVYEGDKAVYIRRNNSDTGLGYAKIQYYFDRDLSAGDYTVTFYAKGSVDNPGQTTLRLRYNADESNRFSNYEKTYAGDGWYRYTKTQTVPAEQSEGPANFMEFCFSGWVTTSSFYMDGISVKDSGGTEYCLNGGFEDCFVIDDGEPTSLVAYSASNVNEGDGVIAWYNPEKSNISDITLKVDGVPVVFTPVLTSGGYNEVVLENLEDKNAYSVALSITADKTYTVEKVLYPYSASNNYGAAGNRRIDGDGWNLNRSETVDSYAETALDIDSDIKYSGNSSLRITCGRLNQESDVYASLVQHVTLKKNASYRFSAKVRYVGLANTNFFVQGIYNTNNGWWANDEVNKLKANATREYWETWSYDIDARDGEADDDETYTRAVQFIIQDKAAAVWLDDISIYEVVDGVEDTSVNYIRNGGFEYGSGGVESDGYSFYETYEGEVVGEELSSLTEGNVLGVAKIRNYSGETVRPGVVAALYKDGRLIDISTVTEDVPVHVNPYDSCEMGVTVSVPEMDRGSVYFMRVMVWKSLNTGSADYMKPFFAAGELR